MRAPSVLTAAAAQATYGMTSGRVGPSVVAVLALVGAVAGVLAVRRGTERPARRAGLLALVLGIVGSVAGAVFAVTADGGPGTGNGLVGAVVAVVLGLVGVVLGAKALARDRRAAPSQALPR